jgi:hypothetical protein
MSVIAGPFSFTKTRTLSLDVVSTAIVGIWTFNASTLKIGCNLPLGYTVRATLLCFRDSRQVQGQADRLGRRFPLAVSIRRRRGMWPNAAKCGLRHCHRVTLRLRTTVDPWMGKSCKWRTYQPWRDVDSRSHIGHRPDPGKTAETTQPASCFSAARTWIPGPGANSVFAFMRVSTHRPPPRSSVAAVRQPRSIQPRSLRKTRRE